MWLLKLGILERSNPIEPVTSDDLKFLTVLDLCCRDGIENKNYQKNI